MRGVKLKVIFLIACCAILCKSSAIESDVLAETVTVGVTAELTGSFSVLIPKTIVLNGFTGVGEYTIGIKGDLPAGRIINVQPTSDSITLETEDKKNEVTADITQNKTSFEYSELDVNTYTYTTGSIAAQQLRAGVFEGTVTFGVSLEYIPGLYDSSDIMICRWEDSGIDIEKDYTASHGACDDDLPIFTLAYGYPETTKVIIPENIEKVGNNAFYQCEMLECIELPSTIMSIGSRAFYACLNLKSVSLLEGVELVGDEAFSYCQVLESIELPKTVLSIGNFAFYECLGLKSVLLQNNIKSIGMGAFYDCQALENIELPKTLESIGAGSFMGCAELLDIVIPEGIKILPEYMLAYCTKIKSVCIPEKCTYIGEAAFYGCSAEETPVLNIPEGVTYIGDYAFAGSSGLKSVSLPSSLENIGVNPFTGCANIESMTVAQACQMYTSRDTNGKELNAIYSNDRTTLLAGCKMSVISDFASKVNDSAFAGMLCDSISMLDLKNVTILGDSAFSKCPGIIGDIDLTSVTEVGSHAFSACENIQSLSISDSVTVVSEYAFSSCTKLKRVVFKSTVYSSQSDTIGALFDNDVSIGKYAFKDTGLSDWVNGYAPGFYDADDNLLVTWSDIGIDIEKDYSYSNYQTTATSGYYVYQNDTRLANAVKVVIPGSTYTIGTYVMASCSIIEEVVLPNTVYSISSNVFRDCSGLAKINMPRGVEKIGTSAFYECNSVVSIEIPKSVTTIDQHTFSGCTSLVSITIPDGVTTIKEYAFSRCKLSSLNLPKTVVSVAGSSFADNSSLNSIHVAEENLMYTSTDLEGLECNAVMSIDRKTLVVGCKNTVIPESIMIVGEYAFQSCTGLSSLSLPEGLTTIGSYAFWCCYGLKSSIVIPDSVTVIESKAFGYCRYTPSFTYKGNTYTSRSALMTALESNGVTVGTDAFMGTDKLTD